MIFKAGLVLLLLSSVVQCDRSLTQVSGSKASYDALVDARQGAPGELVQVIDSILVKFFPDKFSQAGSSGEVSPPTTTATPTPTSIPPTTLVVPAAPVTTAASATSRAPVSTAAPVTTAASATSQAPVSTAGPVTTQAPVTTAVSATTATPVTTQAAVTTALPATTQTPPSTATVIPPGCAGPAVVLNFDDPIFDGQTTPTTPTPVPLTSPFTYHGLSFTSSNTASLALYNAALSVNPSEASLAGDSNSPPAFLVSRGGGFTVTTSTGTLQIISVFLSAPNLEFGAAGASISGTVASAPVPACGVGSPQFPTSEMGYLEVYSTGGCVVDTLTFSALGYAVGIDTLTVCTAAASGPSSLTVTP